MLVLSRKINEAIVLGQDIRVTVLGIEGDRVRIGIDAPRSLRIYRHELLEQTVDTNLAAANAPMVIFNIKKPHPQAEKTEEERSAAPQAE